MTMMDQPSGLSKPTPSKLKIASVSVESIREYNEFRNRTSYTATSPVSIKGWNWRAICKYIQTFDNNFDTILLM